MYSTSVPTYGIMFDSRSNAGYYATVVRGCWLDVVVMWLLSRNAYGMDETRWRAEPLHGRLVRSLLGDARGHGTGVVERTV